AQMLANTINFFGVQVYSTTAVNFYDVNSTHWFINAVEEVNNNGIMTGKSAGRFAPYDKLTRAESAKIIRTLIGNIDQF
ncbi:S-layer homology domain-containing protein, partial [Candidatus Peregrinibacteria bacterium]|nr:S-layer homology domain-containing protein [Candidatus Peregrinibacteria bacterium]